MNNTFYKGYFEDRYLAHHGILGMKWGKKNGPPYPLGASDHSPSEKAAGYEKSLGGGRNEELYNKKKAYKTAKKQARKSYRAYDMKAQTMTIPTKKRIQEIDIARSKYEHDKAVAKDAKQAWKAEVEKEKLQKVDENGDPIYTKQEIDKHRAELLNKFKDDKYRKELYKNATDSQIAIDKRNRDRLKKAIIAGVLVAGTGATVYMLYKSHTNKALRAAMDVSRNAKDVASVEQIMKKYGLSLDLADNVMKVSSPGELLDGAAVNHIIDAARRDMDIAFKEGQQFARVDFHKDFSIDKANPFLYIAGAKRDNDTYKQVLPNRTGLKEGAYNYFLEATKEIRMPSLSKTEKMLEKMYKSDPAFQKGIDDALVTIMKNNIEREPFIKNVMRAKGVRMDANIDDDIRRIVLPQFNEYGIGYKVSTALTGNQKLHTKVFEEFQKEGYNAMLDIHDIKDGTARLPIVALEKDSLTITGKEVLDRLLDK